MGAWRYAKRGAFPAGETDNLVIGGAHGDIRRLESDCCCKSASTPAI
jgi:hypothetical protein